MPQFLLKLRFPSVKGSCPGTHSRAVTATCPQVHIAGVGDTRVESVSPLPDPCPLPDATKRRSLNEKEKVLYAPLADVGEILYDKDAVYINIPDHKVQYSKKGEPTGEGEEEGKKGGGGVGVGGKDGEEGSSDDDESSDEEDEEEDAKEGSDPKRRKKKKQQNNPGAFLLPRKKAPLAVGRTCIHWLTMGKASDPRKWRRSTPQSRCGERNGCCSVRASRKLHV